MVKGNTLDDMHNMLMEQMTKLADCETKEELELEKIRATAMTGIAAQIINNCKNVIDAQHLALEYGENPVVSSSILALHE